MSYETLLTLGSAGVVSVLTYSAIVLVVPRVAPEFKRRGLKGRDLLKDSREEIPESQGTTAASLYILILALCAPLPFLSHLYPLKSQSRPLESDSGPEDLQFPHHSLSVYLATLLSLLVATFLGFLDDVFDIRWRYKVPIPSTFGVQKETNLKNVIVIASVPLLLTYSAEGGITDIVLPKMFGIRRLLGVEDNGGLFKLGPLYYLYMSLLSTFCTNSINILAGINGVEVSQALIISMSLSLNSIVFIIPSLPSSSPQQVSRHLFSLYFTLPLTALCFALLRFNGYPSRVFIGDSFCYFVGMAFSVAFNFLYSCPQIFGIIDCPRHRVPFYNRTTKMLEPSVVTLKRKPTPLQTMVLQTLNTLGMLHLEFDPSTGAIEKFSNLTILNLFLVLLGPMSEKALNQVLILSQVAGSILAFTIRYGLAGVFYDSRTRR